MPGPTLFLPGPGPWFRPPLSEQPLVAVEAVIPLQTADALADATLALTAVSTPLLETAAATATGSLTVTAPTVVFEIPDVVMAPPAPAGFR